MDGVRGEFSGQGGSDVADDDGGATAGRKPGNDERRMQVRAYNFWASLLGEKTFPDIADLDPGDLPDFGPRSVLLDFSTGGIEDPAIAYVGSALASECGASADIRSLAHVPGGSLLSRITDHYMQILANEAPIGFEAEYVNARGMSILYRGILMPFSRSGDRIDYIYGVINWKESADPLPARIDAPAAASGTEVTEPVALRVAEPLTDWADGPAELVYGDFALPGIDAYVPMELPQPGFAFDTFADVEAGLADRLASAREMALIATRCEERSHQALYEAIGRACDFVAACLDAPEDLAELLEDAGLQPSERAPLLPLLRLVFGVDYDKTRMAEFATVIAHAHRIGLAEGTLAAHLAATPGGLKALVNEERRLRRADSGVAPADAQARLVSDLRSIAARSFADIAATGGEFTVLVARRLPGGEVVLVGEVEGDDALLRRAARHLLG